MEGVDHWTGLPGRYQVVRCGECRHRYLNPRPKLEALAACYPAEYAPHQPEVGPSQALRGDGGGAVRPWYLRWFPLGRVPGLKRLYSGLMEDSSQLLLLPGDYPGPRPERFRALEVGCATGRFLQAMAEAGWEVTGVEPMSGAALRAQRAGFEVYVDTVCRLGLSPESYEWICAWMVIEHVPDPRETLAEMHRLLVRGGVLTISLPNCGSWEAWWFGSKWYGWDLPRHLQHFTPASICGLLEVLGYRDVRVQYQANGLNWFGSMGILLRGVPGLRGVGKALMGHAEQPRWLWRLLTAPLAHGMAWIGQGGRMTIMARKV